MSSSLANAQQDVEGRRVLSFSMRPKQVFLVLSAAVAVLGFSYALTKLVQVFLAPAKDFGIYQFFHLGQEANLPAYFSALLILFAGILAGAVSSVERQEGGASFWHWRVLSIGLVFMSFDEAAQIHESIIGPLFTHFAGRGDGIWHYAWYIPFIPVVLLLAAWYVPFIWRLRRRYAVLFVLAGVLYVGGAIGVEMMQSYISFHRITGGAMAISLIVEEMCEMMGMVVVIYALLCYLIDKRSMLVFFQPPQTTIDAR